MTTDLIACSRATMRVTQLKKSVSSATQKPWM